MNPVIAEVWRGPQVESRHTGAVAVVDADGHAVLSRGNIEVPIYPRSAIKAFQCVPVIESGAADHFRLSDEEIALCCASHDGEPDHVRVARSMLGKIGVDETAYECGAHLPSGRKAAHDLIRHNHEPMPVHNNCSGKHAGMLALARHLGVDPGGYTTREHPVQRAIAATISRLCHVDMEAAPVAVDGCSVPTWALPLRTIAHGFARLSRPAHDAGRRIIAAVRAYPFMVGGTASFDTRIMTSVPRLFIKVGAEGVYCGCIPHAGLGFALKCDDGAVRAAEVAIAGILSQLSVWSPDEKDMLANASRSELRNWRKLQVGHIRAA